ncbi:MAG TPA: hypothetical protein VMZ53_14390 [Kofleriaceae bacterium]|nr:hypothetical protein [Kofleriaceae bacterium]
MRWAGIGVYALVAVSAAGCNAVFDLAPTIPLDAATDFDHDGVDDGRDNCALLANADQANRDEDAFGDACDTCPQLASASVHDEEGDFTGDDCDPCPGIPDFNDDTDGDGIGDLCDPEPGPPNRRLLFETFEAIAPEWHATGVPWTGGQDAVWPTTNLPSTDRGLENSSLIVTNGYTVVVGVESSMRWTTGDRVEITATRSADAYGCKLECTASTCNGSLTFGSSGGSGVGIVGARPYMRAVMARSTAGYLNCSWGEAGGIGTPSTTASPTYFSVAGSAQVHVAYVEVIE